MKLKFINPAYLDKNLKATVHKTGKLGFTIEAAKKMGLSTDKSVAIAINDEDKWDTSLYLEIHPLTINDTFKISKAGEYHYINTKDLFDNLKVDYKEHSVIYDISEEMINGSLFYKLKRREMVKKPVKGVFSNTSNS